jgi:hypothetical protein
MTEIDPAWSFKSPGTNVGLGYGNRSFEPAIGQVADSRSGRRSADLGGPESQTLDRIGPGLFAIKYGNLVNLTGSSNLG